MLGAQRTSVTLSASTLQEAGMIEYKRGKIRILNVDRLRDAACECCQAVNDVYAEIAVPRDH
jgi:RNA:NAD 2'-phosphotransferase (TPT1/KptA family)